MDSDHRSNKATDLQSAPFGRSGTLPNTNWTGKNGAGRRIRTPDLLITNQLLYQLSYASIFSTRLIYHFAVNLSRYTKKIRKWSRWQGSNLRHLGPKPSTLPSWATPRCWRYARKHSKTVRLMALNYMAINLHSRHRTALLLYVKCRCMSSFILK